ncbi:NADH:ubiquinone oxidoreductase subunit NDUFA12 [Phreatobacter stygius]|uniref:NADH:ubiquinone oxidoreductase subunit NDUFA12 n=1 Tax=Phreatobacter stygius TaxID=1940610 RepID=A0A4D7B673_9HYPH|nr:NADH:ubiquinone oxidoreductase subunit NDUFA12 [Phreatobacter stygius]QCI65670.1 NADH:ubiquinone oxidoreductase subunit NDUFA12 [Phreatobacter stygius]
MKTFFLKFFTWWNSQTFGTQYTVWRYGVFVGEDEAGNKYYRSRYAKDPALGHERRWVVYKGLAEASAIPPGWWGWMHHKTETPPTEEAYEPRPWQKPHLQNMTGTAHAYRPPGSTLAGGKRPHATGDYEAWTPGR